MPVVNWTVALCVEERDVPDNPTPYSTWIIHFPNDGGLIVGAYPSTRPNMTPDHLDLLINLHREDFVSGVDIYWKLCHDRHPRKSKPVLEYIEHKIQENNICALALRPKIILPLLREPEYNRSIISDKLSSKEDRMLLEKTAYCIARSIVDGKVVYLYDQHCHGLIAVISIMVVLMIYHGASTESIELDYITHHVQTCLNTINYSDAPTIMYDNCTQKMYLTRNSNSNVMKGYARDIFSREAAHSYFNWIMIMDSDKFDNMMGKIDLTWVHYQSRSRANQSIKS